MDRDAVEFSGRDAGGILLGKTATWEFAHGGPSWDVLFPPARNPWNTAHHPAGLLVRAVAAGFHLGQGQSSGKCPRFQPRDIIEKSLTNDR
jgi:aspartyl-tRNA(Asn)/glutamyl-tRNA(Gln) amidotransferase subunit A